MNKQNRENINFLQSVHNITEDKARVIVLGKKKPMFADVTEAARFLVRVGAKLSLKDRAVYLPSRSRGLKALSAADFVCKTYNLRLI